MSLPPDYPLVATAGPSLGTSATWPVDMTEDGRSGSGENKGKGKGKEKEQVWEGMRFQVPGFHDEVFWECASLCAL